jgi:hypothetical protein
LASNPASPDLGRAASLEITSTLRHVAIESSQGAHICTMQSTTQQQLGRKLTACSGVMPLGCCAGNANVVHISETTATTVHIMKAGQSTAADRTADAQGSQSDVGTDTSGSDSGSDTGSEDGPCMAPVENVSPFRGSPPAVQPPVAPQTGEVRQLCKPGCSALCIPQCHSWLGIRGM